MMHRLGTVLCTAVLVVTLQAGAETGDYLPADLRSRVDQLKVERATIPTRPANLRARAELTLEWLNAYAIDGTRPTWDWEQPIVGELSLTPCGD